MNHSIFYQISTSFSQYNIASISLITTWAPEYKKEREDEELVITIIVLIGHSENTHALNCCYLQLLTA